jgi:hypothetical protein
MSAEHDPARGTGEPAPERDDDFLERPVDRRPYGAEGGAESADPGSQAGTVAPSDTTATTGTHGRSQHSDSHNMLPARETRRSALERMVVRLIATCGIVGIGVAIAAIMVSSKSQGWVVGLVVSIVSVVLAALLWSSKQL